MSKIKIVDISWVVSALGITFLSHFFFSRGPDYTGGFSYPLFYSVYVIGVLLFSRIREKKLELNINPLIYIFGTALLMTGEPLFENDHFRYLWEGKVLMSGENPYAFAPDSSSLDHIDFPMRSKVGFPWLSSIYPPISLIWFSIGSFLPYEIGLRVLMFLNAWLVFLVMRKIFIRHNFLLLLLFPLLQKEFIQAVHIDLLAVLPFFLVLISPIWNTKFLGLFISFWIKINTICAFPFILLKERNHHFKKLISLAFIPISLLCFFYLMMKVLPGDDAYSGMKAFSSHWEWNSGFYSILKNIFNIKPEIARPTTFISFVSVYLMLLFKFLKNKIGFNQALLLVFTSLMFFSPVYNGWYSIWFIPFALQLGSLWGVLYACASSFGYVGWGQDSFWTLRICELLTHIFYIILIWGYLKPSVAPREAANK